MSAADPRRPALAAVLSALTPRHRVWWEMAVAAYGPLWVERGVVRGRYGEGHPFDVHELDLGEVESLRCLRAAGLLPPEDSRRAWPYDPRLGDTRVSEHLRVIGPGVPAPRVDLLVSVASLGVGLWLRAEDIVRGASPGAIVQWVPPWAPDGPIGGARLPCRRLDASEWPADACGRRVADAPEATARWGSALGALAQDCGVRVVEEFWSAGEGLRCVRLAAPWAP